MNPIPEPNRRVRRERRGIWLPQRTPSEQGKGRRRQAARRTQIATLRTPHGFVASDLVSDVGGVYPRTDLGGGKVMVRTRLSRSFVSALSAPSAVNKYLRALGSEDVLEAA